MKIFYLIFWVLLYSGYGLSQNTFSRDLGLPNKRILINEIEGGGYLLSAGDASSIILQKINSAGYLVWERKLNSRNLYTVPKYPFAEINHSEFLLINQSSNLFYTYEVLCLFGDGEIKFQKEIEISSHRIIGLKKINNTEFFLLYFSSTGLGVTKINTSGEKIIEYNYELNIAQKNYYSAEIIDSTAMIVSIGDNLLKINSEGTLLWLKNNLPLLFFSIDKDKNIIGYTPGKLLIPGKYLIPRKLLILNKNGDLVKEQQTFLNPSNIAVTNSNIIVDHEGAEQYLLNYNLDIINSSVCRHPFGIITNTSDAGFIYSDGNFLSKADSNGVVKAIDYLNEPDEKARIMEPFNINWYHNKLESVNIEVSTNNGQEWHLLTESFPADSFFTWVIPYDFASDHCLIRISDSENSRIGSSSKTFTIHGDYSYDYIAANEIKMWAANNGDGSRDPRRGGKGFYWPGGEYNTGKSAIFVDGLVWGLKKNGKVYVNGNTHRPGIKAGNINESGSAGNSESLMFRILKMKKNWESLPAGHERNKYERNKIDWPVQFGAPWVDINKDGIYSYNIDQAGTDADETLFYVANDTDTTTCNFTFGSDPIGLEFQTTIFAYNTEELKNVVFKKYVIINKSGEMLKDMYLTYFSDPDLGDANDDFMGFDTTLAMSYCYNSDNNDWTYGTAPPAVGHQIVQSPVIKASQNDSAFFKNRWHKGYKNVKMNASGMIAKSSSTYPRDPTWQDYAGSLEFYNMMKGLTNAGNPIINPLTGQSTTYPLCGDPVSKTGWYQGDGWPRGLPPADVRMHLPCGPFNMAPGDTQEVVYAILIARGEDNINSITKLREGAAYYYNFYRSIPPVNRHQRENIINSFDLSQNYPNPFNPVTRIKFTVRDASNDEPDGVVPVSIKLYDLLGRLVMTLVNDKLYPGEHEIELNGKGLSSGVYFYRMEAEGFTTTKKMILLR